MPYCVNCGVELAPSEPKCPLCTTPVIQPEQPWQEPMERPYPEQLDTSLRHVNRQYGAHLASITLLVPVLVCLLVDFLINMRLFWSLYVMGAGAVVFCCALLPFYTKEKTPYLSLFVDALSVLLYLLLIALLSGSLTWFWRLALPLTTLLWTAGIGCVFVFRRIQIPFLINLSTATFVCGVLLIVVELIIDLFVNGIFQPSWSPYALVPFVALAVMFRVISRKQRLLENIRKRLYM